MRADFSEAYINLGDILIRQSKITSAIEVYQLGLIQGNGMKNADLYYNIGVAKSMLLRQQSVFEDDSEAVIDEIAEYFSNATIANPFHKEALINLAILIQRNERTLAKFRPDLLEKMKNYNGAELELVYFNLALLLSDSGDNEAAIYYLNHAIEIKADFRSALFNLALILVENKRFLEAEKNLNHLLFYHPNHTKSLLLLGDLYINQFKNLDAAEKVR